MIALFDRSCGRHRRILLESLGGRWDEATPGALAHLDRCRRCERELSMTALALAGLRRLAAESRTVEPPAGGWALVRERLQSPPARWPAAFGFGKAVVSVGVLVAVMVPTWLGPSNPQLQQVTEPPPAATLAAPAHSRATGATSGVQSARYTGPRIEKGPRQLNPSRLALAAHSTTETAPPPPPAGPGRTK